MREIRVVATYVLTIAVMNVPQGRLQLSRLVRFRMCWLSLSDLVQGPLDVPALGLVRTATTMKAMTNRMSNTTKIQRRIRGRSLLSNDVISMTMRV